MKEENRELSERKKLILKAIIDAHIENGEPVGSKFLTQNKQIAYSSATIRNEMADGLSHLSEYGSGDPNPTEVAAMLICRAA